MSIEPKVGCTPQTLVEWVRLVWQTRVLGRNQGVCAGVTSDERERMRALEHKTRELRHANEILRQAGASFAKAELDRRPKS